jgi:hypothetical protein
MIIVFKTRARALFRKGPAVARSNAGFVTADGNSHSLRREKFGTARHPTIRSFAFGSHLEAAARALIREIIAGTRRIIREATTELARINRAGLGADVLDGKSRGDRARIVASSLSRRHKGHHRCC